MRAGQERSVPRLARLPAANVLFFDVSGFWVPRATKLDVAKARHLAAQARSGCRAAAT